MKSIRVTYICPICKEKRKSTYYKEHDDYLDFDGNDKILVCRNCSTKNKRTLLKSGYYIIRISDEEKKKYFPKLDKKQGNLVLEHRYNMSKHLGRPLENYEIIHHKNGIKTHNDISNLEIVDKYNHPNGYFDGYMEGFRDGYNEALKKSRSNE